MQSKLISAPVNASLSFLYSISCSLPYEHYIMNFVQDVSAVVSPASSETDLSPDISPRQLNFFCSYGNKLPCICDYHLSIQRIAFLLIENIMQGCSEGVVKIWISLFRLHLLFGKIWIFRNQWVPK